MRMERLVNEAAGPEVLSYAYCQPRTGFQATPPIHHVTRTACIGSSDCPERLETIFPASHRTVDIAIDTIQRSLCFRERCRKENKKAKDSQAIQNLLRSQLDVYPKGKGAIIPPSPRTPIITLSRRVLKSRKQH